jgi:hypothetical protein
MTTKTFTIAGTVTKVSTTNPEQIQILSNKGNHLFVLTASDITNFAINLANVTVGQTATLTVTRPLRMYKSVTAVTLG